MRHRRLRRRHPHTYTVVRRCRSCSAEKGLGQFTRKDHATAWLKTFKRSSRYIYRVARDYFEF